MEKPSDNQNEDGGWPPDDDRYDMGWVDAQKNFEWKTLPNNVPEGKEPGSGFWVRIPGVDEEPRWVDYPEDTDDLRWEWAWSDAPPSSSQSMTAAHADPPGALGPGRARRAGIRIGRILGIVVKGLTSTRVMNKKQALEEKNDGYVVDWDKDEGSARGE